MDKLLKKIYHKLKQSNTKKHQVRHTNKVENVLVLFEGVLCDSFNNALGYIKDDFKFTVQDVLEVNLNDINFIDFDFVIIHSSVNKVIINKLKKQKLNKVIVGMMLDKNTLFLPKNSNGYIDLFWFSSFEKMNKLEINIPKIHANCGDESHQDKSCPSWDYKYLGNQIRKGLQHFEAHSIKATIPFKSKIKFKAGRCSFYDKNILITGNEVVEIGSFCSFGKNIGIYTSNHDINYASTQGYIYRKFFNDSHPGEKKEKASLSRSKGPVIIKNDVWIGDGAKIMSGVTIGNGACIGAGSVVTKNVNDYDVVAGVPAKKIKTRFANPEVVSFLLKTEWWNWSDRQIRNNKAFFETNFNEVDDLSQINIFKD